MGNGESLRADSYQRRTSGTRWSTIHSAIAGKRGLLPRSRGSDIARLASDRVHAVARRLFREILQRLPDRVL